MKTHIISEIDKLIVAMRPKVPSSIVLYPADYQEYLKEAHRLENLSDEETVIKPDSYRGIEVCPLYGDCFYQGGANA
ncbi:MAG: hypothetical protein ABW088_12910 [Sedimenticola sp.]